MADWFPKSSIGDLPARAAQRWGSREALVFGEWRFTHQEVDQEVDRVASALIAAGVRKGDNIAVWLPNVPEFIFLLFGIIKAGAVIVPLNIRYRVRDLAYALKQSQASMLITTSRAGPVDLECMVAEVLEDVVSGGPGEVRSVLYPDLRSIVFFEGGTSLQGARSWAKCLAVGQSLSADALADRAASVDPDDTAVIMYTSGTTGDAKGVMLDHSVIRLWTDRASAMGITCHDIQLNYLPLFHAYSLCYGVGHCIITGAKQILTETFDPVQAIGLIGSEKVTIVHGFDTHYQGLLSEIGRQTCDLSSLRVGTFSAGLENSVPYALETQKRICPTIAAYGMTETWSGITQSPLDSTDDQRCRASGLPMPGIEVRVVDPQTGDEMPAGEQGEIQVRGYCLMKGYFRMPEASAKMFDPDGWMKTGDAGIMRSDGHLRFVGRYKDMLKVGGENMAPAEVEALILDMGGIDQVAVVGMPDQRLGEVAAAFVQPAPGARIDPEEVIEFCRGKVASFKIPRLVLIVSELPMTASGKVQKAKLRQSLLERDQAGVT